MSLLLWLKAQLRWWNTPLFKTKKSLPESPPQETQTSNTQSDIVLQSLEVKSKQEQMKFFEKQNDLRDVVFDLNPTWDNHMVYGQGDKIDEEDLRVYGTTLRGVTDTDDDKYWDKHELPNDYNPWEIIKKKNYYPTQQELNELKLTEDANDNTHGKSSSSICGE